MWRELPAPLPSRCTVTSSRRCRQGTGDSTRGDVHMAVKEHAVQERHVLEFLEEHAQALTSGDVARIADRWHVPCLVVSPQGVIAVSDRSQVEQFFPASVADYHAKGITAARPQDAAVTVVSSAVAAADVRWDHPSPDGGSLGGEHAYYVVSRGQDGKLGIDLYSPGD